MYWSLKNSNGVYDLRTQFKFTVEQALGCGMPPYEVITTPYGLQDGSLVQRIVIKERVFRLVGTIAGDNRTEYLQKRLALANELGRDATVTISSEGEETITPVTLRYTWNGKTVAIDALYRSGLEGGAADGFTEQISLEFVASDPFWRELEDESISLPATSPGNINRVIQRISATVWNGLDEGASGTVYAVLETADYIYIGGIFETVGITPLTVNNVAKWNKSLEQWEALGSGTPGVTHSSLTAQVRSLAADSSGIIYIGGVFDDADGTTVENLVAYDPGTDSFADVGGGVYFDAGSPGYVSGVAVDGDDNLFVTAVVTSGFSANPLFGGSGGDDLKWIAKWNGATWAGLGTSIGINAQVGIYALTISGDNLYIGGEFNAPNDNPNQDNLGHYIISTNTWTPMAVGDDKGTRMIVYALAVDNNGVLWIGGQCYAYEDQNIINGLGSWNGTTFTNYNLGDSVSPSTEAVYAIGTVGNRVYFGGDFSSINGDANKDIVAYYESGTFHDVEIDLKTFATQIRAISVYGASSVVFGFTGTGTPTLPDSTTATNGGTTRVFPTLVVTGPGAVTSLTNVTTGAALEFTGLTLVEGETMTLVLKPTLRSFSSNLRDNLFGTLAPGSNPANFFLVPGLNNLTVQIADTTVTRTLTWTPQHNMLEAVAL